MDKVWQRYRAADPPILSSSVHCACGNRAMTLVAQHADAGHIQQPGVLRAVRSVAGQASLRLDRCVLVNERTAHIGVALVQTIF